MKNVPENELFSAYLDGELTADEQAGVERLLASSPAARQLMDELRALSSTLQSMPTHALGEDLTAPVLRAAERRVLGQKVDGDDLVEAPQIDIDTGIDPDIEPAPSPWKGIGRRLLTPRNLLWPGMAVGVALMIMFSERDADRPADTGDEVAMRQPERNAGADRTVPTLQAPKEALREEADAPSSPEKPADEVRRKAKRRTVAKGSASTTPEKTTDSPVAGGGLDGAAYATKPAATAPSAEAMVAQGAPSDPGGRFGGGGAGRVGGSGGADPGNRVDAVEGKAGGGRAMRGAEDTVQAKAGMAATRNQAARQQPLIQGTTVVVCDVSPEAARGRTFDRLLARQEIAWEDPGQDLHRLADELAATRSAARKRPANSATRQAGEDELELVLVEATPAQIKATLAALNSRSDDFVTVCVRPAPSRPDQHGWTRFNRGALPLRNQRELSRALKQGLEKPLRDERAANFRASRARRILMPDEEATPADKQPVAPGASPPKPALMQAAEQPVAAPAVRGGSPQAPRPAPAEPAAQETGKAPSAPKREPKSAARHDDRKPKSDRPEADPPAQRKPAQPSKKAPMSAGGGHGVVKKAEAKDTDEPEDAKQGKSDDEAPTCRVLFVFRVAQPRDVAAAAAAMAGQKPDAPPPAAQQVTPTVKD